MSTALRTYYRGDELVGLRDGQANATRYYHFDHQGTTQCLTDKAGAVTDRFASDAWGVEVKRTGSSINRHWYVGNAGYYRNGAAAEYIRARYYRPSRGAFFSRDSLMALNPGRPLPYAYVANVPTIAIDPTGYVLCPAGTTQCTMDTKDITWEYHWVQDLSKQKSGAYPVRWVPVHGYPKRTPPAPAPGGGKSTCKSDCYSLCYTHLKTTNDSSIEFHPGIGWLLRTRTCEEPDQTAGGDSCGDWTFNPVAAIGSLAGLVPILGPIVQAGLSWSPPSGNCSNSQRVLSIFTRGKGQKGYQVWSVDGSIVWKTRVERYHWIERLCCPCPGGLVPPG